MTLEQILSEFDEKFKSRPLKIEDGDIVQYPRDYSEVKDLIRTSFSKYQEGLVAGIERMKKEGAWEKDKGGSINDMGFNTALDETIKLIKEN